MKTIRPLLLLLASLVWNFAALANLQLTGPANFNISGAAEHLDDQQASAKTNIVGSITNAALVLKSTVTNFTINNRSFLDLVENSLNTNFPAGARLQLRGGPGFYDFAVTDRTGTNIYQDLESLMIPNSWAAVNVGIQTQTTTVHGSLVGNDTEAFTTAFGFLYDDNALTNTTDGTHSFLFMNCLVQAKHSQNLATGATTENVTMDLTGGGHIRGTNSVTITGTIRARITGNE
jgi:hypothetical protein